MTLAGRLPAPELLPDFIAEKRVHAAVAEVRIRPHCAF
jgi:hypothetical protein